MFMIYKEEMLHDMTSHAIIIMIYYSCDYVLMIMESFIWPDVFIYRCSVQWNSFFPSSHILICMEIGGQSAITGSDIVWRPLEQTGLGVLLRDPTVTV